MEGLARYASIHYYGKKSDEVYLCVITKADHNKSIGNGQVYCSLIPK